MGPILAIAAAVALPLVIFWACQLLSLMRMRDEEFPGRYDKILWFIIVFFGSLLGALIFWLWKVGRADERELASEMGEIVSSALKKEDEGRSGAGDV
ncbi:MAG: hypothetical protein ACYS9X_29330 [Planctomycetota bacterium]|jgi:hypothetical protein